MGKDLTRLLSSQVTRRQFLGATGTAALGLLAGSTSSPAQRSGGGGADYFLAVQTHAHDYFFEGGDQACADMRQKGGFNAMLMAATYVSESKWRGHQPGNDYEVEAGAYFFPDMSLYRDAGILPVRAPAAGMQDYDALAEASKGARAAGIQLYAWLSDYDQRQIAGLYPECKVHGPNQKPDPETSWFCLNNPRAQQFTLAFYQDIASNYDVDGFFVDRIRTPEAVGYCFCPYCKQRLTDAGLDADHLFEVMADVYTNKAGLYQYRMLLNVGMALDPVFYFPELPELVAWHGVRMEAVTDHVARVREAVAAINPNLKIGLDLWEPDASVCVGQNPRTLSFFCDWIKPMLYHQSSARDMVRAPVEEMVNASGGELSYQQAYDLLRCLWGARGVQLAETWEAFAQEGMPPEWLVQQTRLAESVVEGRVPIYPGIQGWDPATADQIWTMLEAAFKVAGARGIATYCWSEFTWEKIATYKRFFTEVLGAS